MATRRNRRLAGVSLAAALMAFGAAPALAQSNDRNQTQRQLSWAADEVFQALDRSRGSEVYFDAMEAATDELYRAGLISRGVERFYDRRESSSDWNWGADRATVYGSYHDQVMQVLRRNRGSPAYYQAMEAAADELEGEDRISDAAEEFFDRMAGRAGYGYGYTRGGQPYAYAPYAFDYGYTPYR